MTSRMMSRMTSGWRLRIVDGLVAELSEPGGGLAGHDDRNDAALGRRPRPLALLGLPRRRRRGLDRRLVDVTRSPTLVGGGAVCRLPRGDLLDVLVRRLSGVVDVRGIVYLCLH